MTSRETKVESSIPVQARINIVNLAEMVEYWEAEGFRVKSMSQLISWTVELMCSVLKNNNKMPYEITTVTEAHRTLNSRGLYQGSLVKRSMKKVGMALAFENLRGEGIDPQRYVPGQYNQLHNVRSVEPLDVSAECGFERNTLVRKEDVEFAKKALARIRSNPDLNKGVVREGMTDEEMAERERLDREEIERQNREMDKLLKGGN